MKVIFFCPNILRDAHRHIFHLDKLLQDGYDVVLLDATSFYGNIATATDDVILKNSFKCETLEEFREFKNKLGNEPVLYITFDQYMKFAAPVLNILVREQDKLLTYNTKRFSTVQNPSNKIRLYIDKILKKADYFIPKSGFRYFYRKKHSLFLPDYYLSSTKFVIPTKVLLTIKRKNRIAVHSDDINKVINENSPSVISNNKKVGVFLDQVIPYQDRLHIKLAPKEIHENYPSEYYSNLERTLMNLKHELKLDEVVIALHPDAVKLEKELKNKFKGIRTFLGATNELIRDAHIVFGHSSTALGFAVYYHKPVVLFKDQFLMNNFKLIRDFMTFFEKTLGFKSIYMDKPINNLPKNFMSVDKKKYKDYTQKFLKDNKIQENSFYYAIKYINRDLKEQGIL